MANKKAKGKRAKTRAKFRGNKHKQGINHLIRSFKVDEAVCINIDPSMHAGLPFRRFQGRYGIVTAQRGRSFEVSIQDQGKEKTVIVSPAHLQAVVK